MPVYDDIMRRLTILQPAALEALESPDILTRVELHPGAGDKEIAFEQSLSETDSGHAHTRWLVDDEAGADHLIERIHQRLVERSRRIPATEKPKEIVVVGGGPGGMTAAIECAYRGHKVTVLEKHGPPVRLRCVGLFREQERMLSSLGAPRSLRSEIPASYADKSNIWLFDLIFFLRVVALKLGVVLFENCTGLLDKGRLIGGKTPSESGPVLRREGAEVEEVDSDMVLPFDVVVDASGGHSTLRTQLLAPDAIVCVRDKVLNALERDSDFESYLEGEDSELRTLDARLKGHEKEWSEFVQMTRDSHELVYDDPVCMVCSLERDIFDFPELPDLYQSGLVPPDWVFAPTSYGDKMDDNRWHGLDEEQIRRVHLEGMFPRQAGRFQRPVWEVAEAMLCALGVSGDIESSALERYLREQNSSPYSAHNTMSFFRSHLSGVLFDPEHPLSWGRMGEKEYFVIGDALQTAWFRFGVGVHDSCRGGVMVSQALQTEDKERRARLVHRHEITIDRRAVQSQFALFLNELEVSRHPVMLQALKILEQKHDKEPGESRLKSFDGWHKR